MRRSSGTRAGKAAPLRSMICSHTEAASFTSLSETDAGDLTLQDSGLNSFRSGDNHPSNSIGL